MDGFEALIQTKTWHAIKTAQIALFDIQAALRADGLPDFGEEFAARIDLCSMENRLRALFKERSKNA